MKKLFILLLFTVLMGCSTHVVYQIDGQPAPNNVVQCNVIPLKLKIKYNLTQYYNVKEDDESFKTYKFIAFKNNVLHKIEPSSKIKALINIYNPKKNYYRLEQCISIEGLDYDIKNTYNGYLSRNSLSIDLPVVEDKMIVFYYCIYNESDMLVYQSFRAQYIIDG